MDTGIPPPPPLTSTVTTPIPQAHNNAFGISHHYHSNSSSTSSVIITLIVLSSATIVSATIYFIIRFLSRRCNRSNAVVSDANGVHVISVANNSNNNIGVEFFLPVFTFSSFNGNIEDANCSVCLSDFEDEDQLRLLPLCFHAFHAQCVDQWFKSNQTCPICRSSVNPTEVNKIASVDGRTGNWNNSFRIDIGTPSEYPDSVTDRNSNGLDDSDEIPVESTHRREISDGGQVDQKDYSTSTPPEAAEVVVDVDGGSGRRYWLRDYLDRASASISSRTLSFRGSGRFFTGSSRRSETIEDFEATHGRIGEEISELFRWLSGI